MLLFFSYFMDPDKGVDLSYPSFSLDAFSSIP